MAALFRIEFKVNGSLLEVSAPKNKPLTLRDLSDLLVSASRELRGGRFSFSWKDRDGDNVFIGSDPELHSAIKEQTERGSFRLRFSVAVENELASYPSKAVSSSITAAAPSPVRPHSLHFRGPVSAAGNLSAPPPAPPSRYPSQQAVLGSAPSTAQPRVGAPRVAAPFAAAPLAHSTNTESSIIRLTNQVERLQTMFDNLEKKMEEKEKALMDKLLAMEESTEARLAAKDRELDELKSSLDKMRGEQTEKERKNLLVAVRRLCTEAGRMNVSPLFHAAEIGDTEGVQALLRCTEQMVRTESEQVQQFMRGRAIDRINFAEEAKDQYTPLHVAAKKGHTAIVNLLIQNKAVVEAKDKGKWTPLLIAAEEGKVDVVSCLISNKAKLEATNWSLCTPLHNASYHGHKEVVSLLLQRNASIEAKDKNQRTPLHLAAANNCTEIVPILLTQRANIEAKDKHHRTPLSIASHKGHLDMVDLLISRNANVAAMNT